MIDILYCCDENYSKQLQCSMFTILQNVDEPVTFHIIHKSNFTKNAISKYVTSHKQIHEIKYYEFSEKLKDFPNIQDAHVSEATYYRLFMDKYIPKDVKNLVYVDADIICYDNPLNEIRKVFDNLEQSNHTISVKSEKKYGEYRSRLGTGSLNYFNAGVMFINNTRWNNKNIGDQLRKLLINNTIHLEFWDQDLLNIFFDGDYLELDRKFNFKFSMEPFEKIKKIEDIAPEGMFFLHYSGKFKPWSYKGILNKKSSYYQDVYMKLFAGSYHLQYNWKGNVIKDIFKSIINLELFRFEKTLKLFFTALKSLFRENEKY